MKVRNRFDDEDAQNSSTAGDPGDGDLDRLRQVASEFLAAGDEAINRALSGNSERFLEANRQQGGQ